MSTAPLAQDVARRIQLAAQSLGTANPVPALGRLLQRTFPLPPGDPRYARNALTPGAAPLEASFSEGEPSGLRLTLEPLEPGAGAVDRRDEATREMRRLVGSSFGREALRWFDGASEDWRGMANGGRLNYGAFFGTAYDHDGLYSSKVYYETLPHQIESLPYSLFGLVSATMKALPSLHPLFTTIACRRDLGSQRLTFLNRGPLRLADLAPLLETLGLQDQLAKLMQIFGVALGGRFEFPQDSLLLAVGYGGAGPELELYAMLGIIPDVPPNFLDLLALGMSERPKELAAMGRWLSAFTPDDSSWPGHFSVLSVRVARDAAPLVSVYLRPAEFEIADVSTLQSPARSAA